MQTCEEDERVKTWEERCSHLELNRVGQDCNFTMGGKSGKFEFMK